MNGPSATGLTLPKPADEQNPFPPAAIPAAGLAGKRRAFIKSTGRALPHASLAYYRNESEWNKSAETT
ncbi:hypothetical protein PMI40_01913 [Herbaspirillum sp. YR522]|nr:hypothetical protein PMI40_01913 [Herbaspirillum sp. YR522]